MGIAADAPGTRFCHRCGIKMSPRWPRVRGADGEAMLCPMCHENESRRMANTHVSATRYAARLSAPRPAHSYRPGDLRSLARYMAARAPHIIALGHGTGDETTSVLHCPFCGSGKVIARPDGTIACDFCDSAFVVKVEPAFSGYPQSVDGQPVPMPGVPPEEQEQPGEVPQAGDPQAMDDMAQAEQQQAASPMAPPDQAQPPGQAPTAPPPQQQAEQPQPPPRQAYRTTAGHRLGHRDFLRHLALRHTRDRQSVLAIIHAENRS